MQLHLLQATCLIITLNLIKQTLSCPPHCACLWKNGKQTVECRKKHLPEIPAGLDPATQVLDFSGNKLDLIPKETFVNKQLVNLQRLFLPNCSIKSIHKEAFNGLLNLVELDLSNNLLDVVPSESLLRCTSLMKLTLSNNPIASIQRAAFENLSQLNTLELSDCDISEVEVGAFQGLLSLEWLHLDGNRLKTIQGRSTLPEYLKGIELARNQWRCDCNLQDLALWLKDYKKLLSEEPVCNEPARLATKPIRSTNLGDLACFPSITPTSFYLEIGEGKNVSLVCHVKAIPEASVSWWFQGQMLQNDTIIAPGVHLIYYVEEGAENKKSELFIHNANADDNGTFVCNAENVAGAAQANFTIKIVLKENPIVIVVSFPFEYVLIGIVGISVLGVAVIVAFIALVVKCRVKGKRKRMGEKDRGQFGGGALGEGVKDFSEVQKQQPGSILHIEDVTAFELPSSELHHSNASPHRIDQQIRSLDSFKDIQLKQNPDIINGCRREGDGQDQSKTETFENEFIQIPIARLRESTEFLDGGRQFVDPEGFPIDYGLPKLPCRTQKQFSDGYYRTLPSNRLKRHSAANPFRRISREAEFLSRSVDSPYDNSVDIRYTADGYPARPTHPPIVPNVDATSPTSLPYYTVQWPTCVPANVHVMDPYLACGQPAQALERRSASAQTEQPEAGDDVGDVQESLANELLTESPDEGYEGEPTVV